MISWLEGGRNCFHDWLHLEIHVLVVDGVLVCKCTRMFFHMGHICAVFECCVMSDLDFWLGNGGKCFLTLGTMVRFFTIMNSLMVLHLFRLLKNFSTGFTFEWFFFSLLVMVKRLLHFSQSINLINCFPYESQFGIG